MPTIQTPAGEVKLPYTSHGAVAAKQLQATGVRPDIMNMNTNPFMSIFNGATGAGDMTQELPKPQASMGEGQQKPNPMAIAQGNPDGEEIYDPRAEQLEHGKNPSRSKSLVSAITALESVASDSTDQNEIMLIRGLVSAISRLIAKNQDDLKGLL